MGSERRHDARRSRANLELLALGDLVELFVFRECGGEADSSFLALGDRFVVSGYFYRQDSSRSVISLSRERHDELTKAHGSTDLQAMEFTV